MDIITLREALDDTLRDWSWELSAPQRCDSPEAEWVVTGRLISAEGIYREGLGAGETPELAAHLALEQAAELFGVRLEPPAPDEQEAQGEAGRAQKTPPTPQASHQQRGARPVMGGGGLTVRQSRAICAIAGALGWEPDRLSTWLLDEYEVPEVNELGKRAASRVITKLRALAAERGIHQPEGSAGRVA